VTYAETLHLLSARGVRLEVVGGRLRLVAPRGALTADETELVRRHRSRLLADWRDGDNVFARAAARVEAARRRECARPARLAILDGVEDLLARYRQDGDLLLLAMDEYLSSLFRRWQANP
jgi:hypothetical protein